MILQMSDKCIRDFLMQVDSIYTVRALILIHFYVGERLPRSKAPPFSRPAARNSTTSSHASLSRQTKLDR